MKNIFKNLLKNKTSRNIILLVLIVGLVFSGVSLAVKNNESQEENKEFIKTVSTQIINGDEANKSQIETVGVVEAQSSIDVISTISGTLKGLYFNVGDEVYQNQSLAQLYSSTALTSLNNAQTNLNNIQSSLTTTQRITDESIRQTEIGVEQANIGLENAKKSIQVAELGLKTAQDNLNNAIKIKEKSLKDQKNKAVINFNAYVNTIFSARDQVALLINANTSELLSSNLGAKNPETISETKSAYALVNKKYSELKNISPSLETIESNLQDSVDGLSLSENMLNKAINLLDNTVSGGSYYESTLASQKSSFTLLRANVITALNGAKTELEALSTVDLANSTDITALNNAVSAAEAQLSIAITAKDNAEIAVKNAKQAVESAKVAQSQQLLSVETQVDSARGQYNLSSAQTADLNIKAPIKGTITEKYVELGTEVSIGQKIAQISQLNNMKIVVNVSSEDIYRIQLGQTVMIENNLEGIISSINPSADPVTKKVKAEIIFNNENKELIQGTFVNVSIPVEKIEKSQSDSVFIPLRAVTITANEKYVYVNENGFAKKILVEFGKTENALVEITSGLTSGDELITDGGKLLEDGDEIIIK